MTLTEILIAVMIVSILGTFATVTYVRTYEKARGATAIAMVRIMHAAERLYYEEWNRYTPLAYSAPSGCGTPTSNLVTAGYLRCPNEGDPQTRAFNYTASLFGPTSVVLRATRNGGRYNGGIIQLFVLGLGGSTFWSNVGTVWPAGWVPPN